MRCLYCGKELALLKRLRGGGEFCSDAHKHSYQEEYNRLGLSRLLQARSRADESKGAQKPPSAPVAAVAIAEPAVVVEAEEVAAQAEEIVVEKLAPAPPVLPPPPPVIASPPEPPPPTMAGFAMEAPAISPPPEPVSYLEPWMSEEAATSSPAPSAPAWHLEGPPGEHLFFTLPGAELLPLEMQPGVCESTYSVLDGSVMPRDGGPPKVQLSMPLTVRSSHEFQWGGSIAIEILPRPSESSCYASLNGAVDFAHPAGMVLELLDLSPAGIAFPAEDCEVTVPEDWTNGIISEAPVGISEAPADIPAAPVDITVPAIPLETPIPELPAEPAGGAPPEATPRAALEALSRLHQDMRERQEAKPAAPPTDAPLPATAAASEPPQEPQLAPNDPPQPEPAQPEPTPREAALLAMPLKSLAPPKAGPVIDGGALSTYTHPLLPRLKALPLRPKVAPAPRGFSPQPKAQPAPVPPAQPAVKTPPANAPAPAPVAAPPKPAAAKPTPPVEKAKPSQPPPGKKPAPTAEASQPKPTAAPAQPAPAVHTPVQPKPEPAAKPAPVKSAPAAPKAQPSPPPKPQPAAAKVSQPAAKASDVQNAPEVKKEPDLKEAPPEKAKAAAAASSPTTGPADHTVPNFGAVVNTSMFGSIKVKIGIAVLTAAVAIGAYFQFTPKSKSSVVAGKSSDVGMSIMVGEGGWVENWASDPMGLHAGRQITIYRPSLKLSDYRLEFQGQIDTKSIGWIFRAADPENYYAMKLELVSQELPLTVALYKYMVLKGRQVQVGRVPIDVPVKNDTVFSIRVDVRGPKFNTYVQGQSVDVWTDDQLRSGGVGFLNERSERGKIKSVALSYLSGGTK